MFLVQQAINEQCTAQVSMGTQFSINMTLEAQAKCAQVPKEIEMDINQIIKLIPMMDQDIKPQNILDSILSVIDELLENEGIEEDLSDITADVLNDIHVTGSIPGIYPSASLCVLFEKKSCKETTQQLTTLKGISLKAKENSITLVQALIIPIPFSFEGDPNSENDQALQKSKSTTVATSIVLVVVIIVLAVLLVITCIKAKTSGKTQNSSRDSRVQQAQPQQMVQPITDAEQQAQQIA